MDNIASVIQRPHRGPNFTLHQIQVDYKDHGSRSPQEALQRFYRRILLRWKYHYERRGFVIGQCTFNLCLYPTYLKDYTYEKDVTVARNPNLAECFPDPTVINHNSVKEFFDYIGYDSKNKSVKHTDKLLGVP